MTGRAVGKGARLELIASGAGPDMDAVIHSLDGMAAAGETRLQISCSRIAATDMQSLHALIVLCECARLRGIKPEFVDLTEDIKSAVHVLGAMHCFSDR